ncbi:MAG: hypothetical protein IPJ65_06990 [Archangiaceae bacterium]|nr:hypothetical protein [Archangiaceae bacterium]
MITRGLRQAMKREEGQALVLACLMMLVVAIAVLTTVNLGHNIYERQKLQNTADAAAYSSAALEARAFNFYAFVNRTHVSHYVTAMVWQSIASFVYFVEAMMVDVLGVIETIDCRDEGFPINAVCSVIPTFIPELQAVYGFIGQFQGIYTSVLIAVLTYLRAADPDAAIGLKIVPTYYAMNAMLTSAAEATLKAALREVEQTSLDVVQANDPTLDFTSARVASGRLSKCMLARSHQAEAWHGDEGRYPYSEDLDRLDPGRRREGDKIAKAKRSMSQVSNATRFALDQKNNPQELPGPGWVTSRKLSDLIRFPPSFEQVHDLLVRYVDNPNPNSVAQLGKWGQTKMLTASAVNGRDKSPFGSPLGGGNSIRNWEDAPDFPYGAMAQGDELGSDDLYRINLGEWNASWRVLGVGFENKNFVACRPVDNPQECWGDARYQPDAAGSLPFQNMVKTSIWAKARRDASLHYRLVSMIGGRMFPQGPGARPPVNYQPANLLSSFGLSRIDLHFTVLLGFTLHKWVANVRGVRDGNHWWPGVAPFPNFEPQQYARGCDAGPLKPALFKGDTDAALRAQEFNQPSTLAMLEKKPAQLLGGGEGNNRPALLGQGALDFHFTRQGSKLVMENTRKSFFAGGAEGAGLHVIARGQTYYHRPGNWAEHPNFFNPYWRPRLGSVLLGEQSDPLVADFKSWLPAPLSATPQRAITH